MDAQDTYELRFLCSRYRWKSKEISYPTQLVPHQNMLRANRNYRNNMVSRICQKSVTPVFGPKGLVHPRVARPPPWPLPESRTTPIQVEQEDEDITHIQTRHGPKTRAHARQLNLQFCPYLVNCVLELMLGAMHVLMIRNLGEDEKELGKGQDVKEEKLGRSQQEKAKSDSTLSPSRLYMDGKLRR
jgi:hypothetical protein